MLPVLAFSESSRFSWKNTRESGAPRIARSKLCRIKVRTSGVAKVRADPATQKATVGALASCALHLAAESAAAAEI